MTALRFAIILWHHAPPKVASVLVLSRRNDPLNNTVSFSGKNSWSTDTPVPYFPSAHDTVVTLM